MIPTPSLRTIPLAAASNGLQRPSGLVAPAFANAIVTPGERIRFTPPARATDDSPDQMLRQAMWTATSEDEQAVSRAMLGPRRLSRCEMRLAARLSALPVLR